MSEVWEFNRQEMQPTRGAVLSNQGVPPDRALAPSVEALLAEALDVLNYTARPIGVASEISTDEFASVYRGEGLNAPDTPLQRIYPQAINLCLTTVTLGQAVCDEIERLFAADEPARAAMLDATASAATDQLARAAEERRLTQLRSSGRTDANCRVLLYSPGYCGWHISAQRKLFAALRPELIGVHLRESCLMTPLKSISGVMLAGPAEIHVHEAAYDFCGECRTRSCTRRVRREQNQRDVV